MYDAEHSNDLKNIGVRQSEGDWLMNNRVPPEGWGIWIGRCVPPSQMHWVHAAFRILDSDVLPASLTAEDRIPNSQTTAFSIGQFYFFAMSAVGPEIANGWDWRTARRARVRLQRIWPLRSRGLFWPPPLMAEDDVKSFGTAFIRYMDDLALRVGYAV
jgi:hypothetical protein